MNAVLKIVEELGGETIALYVSRPEASGWSYEFLQLHKDGSHSWDTGGNGVVIEPIRRLPVAKAEFLLNLLTVLFGEKPEPDPRVPDGTVCRRSWKVRLGQFKVTDTWEHPL